MGVVYKAFDRVVKRVVALKTIKDINNAAQLELFYKECELLKSLSHPNIIELFDIGVIDEAGSQRPYFVMPLLKGVTLQVLIRSTSQRLTLARSVEILTQTCRGLQAAHEAGLIHRDLKPSNIFVMEDYSVKIIDFGVARFASGRSETGWKGTLAYMSPEQVELKAVSPASDLFSLGIVAYEALTCRKPFEGQTDREVASAILYSTPPPVSSLNPELNQTIGSVIHKAMAKKPYHRFPSAREFGDSLTKAVRNEPIEIFNPARIQPRIQRATKAFEEGDYQFAAEILHELEAEGYIDPAISTLRGRVDQVVRQKKVQRLIDTARSRFEAGESPLALQKLQEALELDAENAEALGLRKVIEVRRTEESIEEWFRLARRHIDNSSYSHARQAVENVLHLRPNDTMARKLLTEIQHREQEYQRIRQEKEQLFHVARESWQKGEVSRALSNLEKVLELERQAPDRSVAEQENTYLTFYNEVRSEHDVLNNAYTEGRRHLAEHNFDKAKAICDQFLAKYPGNALFQALRFDIEEQLRQERSSFIVETDRRVEAEPDLDRKVAILEEALMRYPGEVHFERGLRLMREKRDFVQSIVVRANQLESQGQFVEAIGQWEILRSIYGGYPGLEFEIERLSKRRDQQLRAQAKAHWVAQIDLNLETGDYARAAELSQSALAEFAGDMELNQLEKLARQGIERTEEAQRLLAEAQKLCGRKEYEKGIEVLRRAFKLDERNPSLRTLLADTLAEHARAVIDHDPRLAEDLVQQALELDPNHSQARGLRTVLRDRRRNEYVAQCRARVRELQAKGDIKGALDLVREFSARLPDETQLSQLGANLEKIQAEERARDIERLRHFLEEAGAQTSTASLHTLAGRAQDIARNYPEDNEVQSLAGRIERRSSVADPAEQPPAGPADDLSRTVVLPPERSSPLTRLAAALRQAAARVRTFGRRPSGPAGAPAGAEPVEPITARAARMAMTVTARPVYWIPMAGAVIVLAAALIIHALWPSKITEPLPPADVSVTIETEPPGADIKIGGELRGQTPVVVQLQPGEHRVELMLAGCESKPVDLQVPNGSEPLRLSYQLVPYRPRIRIGTEVQGGTVSLDEGPAISLEPGEQPWQELDVGPHTVKLALRNREATLQFTADPMAAPTVMQLSSPRTWFMVAVSTYAGSARLFSNLVPLKVALLSSDMQTELKVDELRDQEGLAFDDLSPGDYFVRLGEGADAEHMPIEVKDIPSLSFHQLPQQPTAIVYVITRTEEGKPLNGVRISLDGRERRDPTKDGQLRIQDLDLKQHTFIAAQVPGHEGPLQGKQTRMLVKGRNEIVFTYREIVSEVLQPATLRFRAGPEQVGADVIVDEVRRGTVAKDGIFSLPIDPGTHTITLRKQNYSHRPVSRVFGSGETVELTPEEAALKSTMGTFEITVAPAAGTLRYRLSGTPDWFTAQSRDQEGRYQLRVQAGQYDLEASADGYKPETQSSAVAGGARMTVTFNLEPSEVAFGINSWETPGQQYRWISGNEDKGRNWYKLKGTKDESFVVYRIRPVTGSLSFMWDKKGGGFIWGGKGQDLNWAVGFLDGRNHPYFSFDGKKLRRYMVVNGKQDPKTKVEIEVPGGGNIFWLRITVTPDGVDTEILDQDNQKTLASDSWTGLGPYLAAGRFAFDVHGEEEVWLQSFRFVQKR